MNNDLARSAETPVPDHVPRELVFDYDIWTDERLRDDIQLGMMTLFDDAPDIFWTPRNGGHWMATRIADVRKIVTDTALFSSVDAYLAPSKAAGVIKLPPQDMDPPEHMQHRKLLLKFLGPKDMRRQEPHIVALVNDLIDGLEGRKSCDFKDEIAVPLPVSIFMAMMQWDLSRLREFVGWVHDIIGSNVPERRQVGFGQLMAFLMGEIEEKSRNPGDDPISLLLQSEIGGKKLEPQRVLEMATLLFSAGLDTVTNAMTFMMQHLAQHPEQQQALRDDPDQIDVAVEELLRRFSFVNTQRRVTEDTVFNGVPMKKDDVLIVSLCTASNDPAEFKCPADVDLSRGRSSHVTFNTGPHACIGAPLARLEIRTFLREWLRRMPDVRLAPDFRQVTRGGSVMTIERLDLVW